MKNKTLKTDALRPLNKHGVGSSVAKLLTELSKAHLKLQGLESDMAQLIQQVTEVQDVTVFWQVGDGFVVCDSEANNAPLIECLAIIKDKGRLTQEDYEGVTI